VRVVAAQQVIQLVLLVRMAELQFLIQLVLLVVEVEGVVKEVQLLDQMVVLAAVAVDMMEMLLELVVLEMYHQHPHHKEIMADKQLKMVQIMALEVEEVPMLLGVMEPVQLAEMAEMVQHPL
jgi:hypothetical protein